MTEGALAAGPGLFQAVGVELEYMIVDRESLSVAPIADRLLGEGVAVDGPIAWSNELALHVVELKANGPAASLDGLAAGFQRNVTRMSEALAPLGARLLPTGMHPWMDPRTETKLWPHEDAAVYRAFDRIFGCNDHGWGNIQAAQLNLPFAGDDEFGRLHAAIRLVLPIVPALAASSPIVEGRVSRWLDARMEAYRRNSERIPSVTGLVVPERVFDRRGYEALLRRIYDDLAPHDPQGILRHPWVNARGCIARFDRGTIEIRVIDAQECAAADVAVCAAVSAAVRALTEERFASQQAQRAWPEEKLAAILDDAIESADRAVVCDAEYLRCLGFPGRPPCTLGELWDHLVGQTLAREERAGEWRPAIDVILREGCLARRILRALGRRDAGEALPREELREVYGALARCIATGETFVP